MLGYTALALGIVLTAPISTTATVIAGVAVIATGALLTYAAGKEKVATIEISAAAYVPCGPGGEIGFAWVLDFENETTDSYFIKGFGQGAGWGLNYSSGIVNNYIGSNSYSGPFVSNGFTLLGFGPNHSFDPTSESYSDTVSTYAFNAGFGSKSRFSYHNSFQNYEQVDFDIWD